MDFETKVYNQSLKWSPVSQKRSIDRAKQARHEKQWGRWIVQSLDAHRKALVSLPLEMVLVPLQGVESLINGILYTVKGTGQALMLNGDCRKSYKKAGKYVSYPFVRMGYVGIQLVGTASPDLSVRILKTHRLQRWYAANYWGADKKAEAFSKGGGNPIIFDQERQLFVTT